MSLSDKMTASVDFSAFLKAKDLHKRLWFTLLALIVFRFGTYVPFPGINPSVLSEFF
jgi:preprotein translocase subunit SecY